MTDPTHVLDRVSAVYYIYDDGWTGQMIPPEDALECVVCGTQVSASDTDGLERMKAEHRKACRPADSP